MARSTTPSLPTVPPPGPRKRTKGCGPIALVFLVLLAAGSFWVWHSFTGKGLTLRLTPDQIQTALQKAFPVDQQTFIIKVHLSDPTVSLKGSEGDRISFGSAVGVSIRGMKVTNGTVDASGKLRYDADSGTFYMDSPKVEALHIDKVGGPEGVAVRKAITYVLQKAVRHLPVYTLDPTDPAQKWAKRGIRSVRVVNGVVEITFGLNPDR